MIETANNRVVTSMSVEISLIWWEYGSRSERSPDNLMMSAFGTEQTSISDAAHVCFRG